MFNNMGVSSRLIVLNAIMAVFMIVIGVVGLRGMSGVVDGLHSVYDDRTVPLADLDKIQRLFAANFSEALRAIQHNPASELAKLHDHPVTEHTDRIEANIKAISDLWTKYMATTLTPEEKQIAVAFEKNRAFWVGDILRPIVQSLREGDYSTETVGKFLKGNRSHGAATAKNLDDLMDLQLRVAREEYERAKADYSTVRMLAIGSIVGGVGLGLLIALWIIRSIAGPLDQMRSTIAAVEKNGDFTRRIKAGGNDEVGQTANSFNQLMSTLQAMLRQILDNVEQVSNAARTLAAASTQVAASSANQSEAASSMAATVEEVTVSINHISESAREALNISQKSGELSGQGGDIIHSATSEMEQIAETVRQTSLSIEELGQRSNQISSVVQVIKDVADQTNLLALNAAIEAARAGEQGRGFAVVADEVRKLAERTTKATGEITQMIADMQSSAHAAVATMGNAVGQVGGGVAKAQQAGSAINQIRDGAGQVVRVVNDISAALVEQSAASNDIATHVEKVAQMSEENSSAASQSASAAKHLEELADTMRASVSRFRI
ncbi:MAG: methyl-accepting chemotaxis protein [Betaproteobacteria bacterium]|nr:methyl-accepting chemotaxis protein [Betaproteobacteria bacterium]